MIVAMVGLLYFNYLGWIELDMVFVLPTYLAPMILGGFIMGLGFVIGGFCPGTSYTACAIGKLDGFAFLGGFIILMLGMIGEYIGRINNQISHPKSYTVNQIKKMTKQSF